MSDISSIQENKAGEELIPDIGEEVIDTSFRDARIWKAIDELPEKCREIFLMSKRDGYSNEEIADELGISIKTVKNQMTKALKPSARGSARRTQAILSAVPVIFLKNFSFRIGLFGTVGHRCEQTIFTS